jgi:hypothetical protein
MAVYSAGDTPSPEQVKLILRVLRTLRKQHQAGQRAAPLGALDWCVRSGVQPPAWVARGRSERYIGWLTYRHRSLDEAFGVEMLRGRGGQLSWEGAGLRAA